MKNPLVKGASSGKRGTWPTGSRQDQPAGFPLDQTCCRIEKAPGAQITFILVGYYLQTKYKPTLEQPCLLNTASWIQVTFSILCNDWLHCKSSDEIKARYDFLNANIVLFELVQKLWKVKTF